jgi:TPR repeat protein
MAADQGHVTAQFNLAYAYAHGEASRDYQGRPSGIAKRPIKAKFRLSTILL